MSKNLKREKLKSLVQFMDETLNKMNLGTPLGEYLSYLESLKNSSRSIASIVNGTHSRDGKKNPVTSKRIFNLKKLLNQVTISPENVKLTVDFDPNLPAFLIGNDHCLISLLQSLTSKSCRVNNEEGVAMLCLLDKIDERNADIRLSLNFKNVNCEKDEIFQFDRFERKMLAHLRCGFNVDAPSTNEIRLTLILVFQLVGSQALCDIKDIYEECNPVYQMNNGHLTLSPLSKALNCRQS